MSPLAILETLLLGGLVPSTDILARPRERRAKTSEDLLPQIHGGSWPGPEERAPDALWSATHSSDFSSLDSVVSSDHTHPWHRHRGYVNLFTLGGLRYNL